MLQVNIDLRSLKLFADGADLAAIAEFAVDPLIRGFTTNPTLMRSAGVSDYEAFARGVLEVVTNVPISFEVFSDEFDEMEHQALKIASWGDNVFVKIPVTNTRGESSRDLQRRLAGSGVKQNVTAVFTRAQVDEVVGALAGGPESFLSVFAGRIADAGHDPVPYVQAAVDAVEPYPGIEVIWASPREVYNIKQAADCGCHVITVTPDLLKKLPQLGRDLDDFSLDTVKMFHRDAASAEYRI